MSGDAKSSLDQYNKIITFAVNGEIPLAFVSLLNKDHHKAMISAF